MQAPPAARHHLQAAVIAAAAGAVVTACAGPPRTPADQAARPNIVLVFADDLGYGDLGTYGHPTIRTPHLDRMAEQGMKFTQFYALSSVCSPSRAALMTGRYPMRTGVFRVLSPASEGGLPAWEITLAQALKEAGYATACIGKWHLGHREPYLPTRRGFDRYFGIPYSNDMSPTTSFAPPQKVLDYPPTPLLRDTTIIEREPDQALLTRRYTHEAVRFIRDTQRGRDPHAPFFLYLPHTMPHVPLAASPAFRGRSARGAYGDAVEEIDWSLGHIFGELAALGIDDQTLVIFTSDNGPALMFDQDGGSAGPLRGSKGSTWEGGFRVPAIFRWPGRIPAGLTTPAFGTTMDLFVTALRLAGAAVPADRRIDGADLSPVLLDNHPGREPRLFYWSFRELRAIRRGPWKLHWKSSNPERGDWKRTLHDPPLLYNLHEDPSEQYDLAAKHPQRAAALLEALKKEQAAMKSGPLQW